uniref:Uncharacterized protein n=1 Tax=Parascaris univalens TaxID=6257 RepID=A0A914ZT42_PARUN
MGPPGPPGPETGPHRDPRGQRAMDGAHQAVRGELGPAGTRWPLPQGPAGATRYDGRGRKGSVRVTGWCTPRRHYGCRGNKRRAEDLWGHLDPLDLQAITRSAGPPGQMGYQAGPAGPPGNDAAYCPCPPRAMPIISQNPAIGPAPVDPYTGDALVIRQHQQQQIPSADQLYAANVAGLAPSFPPQHPVPLGRKRAAVSTHGRSAFHISSKAMRKWHH